MMGLDFPHTLMKNSNPSSEDCLSLSSGKHKSLDNMTALGPGGSLDSMTALDPGASLATRLPGGSLATRL